MILLRQFSYFFFCGFFFGFIKSPLYDICDLISVLIKSFFKSFYGRYQVKEFESKNSIINHITDFVFYILLGISAILLCYLLNDGVFRFYLVVFLLCGYILSEWISTRITEKTRKIISKLKKIFSKCFYVLFGPIRHLIYKTYCLFKVTLIRLLKKINTKKLQNLFVLPFTNRIHLWYNRVISKLKKRTKK